MDRPIRQLRYYIALGAPPTRTPATGSEPFMRPEVGFNPSWFHQFCGLDFSETWHADPEYRLRSHESMAREIRCRFPGRAIGEVLDDQPPDLLTGVHGIGILDGIFGRALRYFSDRWPVPVGEALDDEQVDALAVPDLERNAFFQGILDQISVIYRMTGSARGFLNWQGVLNTAFRFRKQTIFTDLVLAPERAQHLFEVITETMILGIRKLHARQKEYGVDYQFATVGNCTVNMVGPDMYEKFLLPCDLKIRRAFRDFGIHNCAWTVTPYLEAYAAVPGLGYLDMGIDSDLEKAKRLFPDTRRNLLYKSTDLKNKTDEQLRRDFERIALELAPCDVGLPDIEHDVPDQRLVAALELCDRLTEERG